MGKPAAVAGGTVVVTKCLTEASLLGPLSLPGAALHSLPHFEADNAPVVIDAVDVKGAVHKLRVSIRGSGKCKKPNILTSSWVNYKKPNILKSSWVPYARAKRLLPKDKLTLSRISGARADAGAGMEIPSYVIRAQRNMFKLFGNPIWVDVEDLPTPPAANNP